MVPDISAHSRIVHKRPHRKSRNGCANCKRRKVKCDEGRPGCQKCVAFRIRCDFIGNSDHDASLHDTSSHQHDPPSQRRSRGRPRKNWSALLSVPVSTSTNPSSSTASVSLATSTTANTPQPSSSLSSSRSRPRDNSATADSLPPPITANTELLLHYISYTAITFTDGKSADSPFSLFWKHNVPRIGLAHPFVMHLLYAVAGHHLLWLRRQHSCGTPPRDVAVAGGSGLGMDIDRSISLGKEAPTPMYPSDGHYTNLLEQHGAVGLAKLNEALRDVNEETCGAAHLGTIVMCYWTFAAGPTGPDDLLVCHVDSPNGEDGGSTWKHDQARAFPLIHGVRITRLAFPPETLFRGLMAPMNTPSDEEVAEQGLDRRRAMWEKTGFARITWERQLQDLHEFLSGRQDLPEADKVTIIRALDNLITIYSANFGRDDDVPNHLTDTETQYGHVLGWLYRLTDGFPVLAKRRERGALVVLAYFALLLRTLRIAWWLDGWAEHLVTRAMEIVRESEGGRRGGEYGRWFGWVADMMGMEGDGDVVLGDVDAT